MTDNPLANRAVREAIQLLRDNGVTPEQYATAGLVERWTVDGVDYPDREAAFCAAREMADGTGEWAEVFLVYGPEADHASPESWIVKPRGAK